MKIGLDITPAVQQHGGIGRYAAELATALVDMKAAPDLGLFYVDRQGRKPEQPLDRLPAKALRWSNKPWRMSVLLASFLGVKMDALCGYPDVFHATDHLLPPFRRARSVFTLHDLAFLSHPETHLASNRWFLTLMVPVFLRRANAVICVSKQTRQDAVDRYKLDAGKLHVIPEGVSPRFRPMADGQALQRVREKYRLPERYILCVSTIEPRKNLTTLLRAFEQIGPSANSNRGLVLVGRQGWKSGEFLAALKASPERARVALLGQIPEEDLPLVYAGADLFVYPSLYEGFGLPVVEAMASGVPVISSNAGSLPEVLGDAGLMVDPHDGEALAEAMDRVLGDRALLRDMRERGLARARLYTWAVTAQRTHEVYRLVSK